MCQCVRHSNKGRVQCEMKDIHPTAGVAPCLRRYMHLHSYITLTYRATVRLRYTAYMMPL